MNRLLIALAAWALVSPAVAQTIGPPPIPASLPPSGGAGGDLRGTYPNPTVDSVANVTTGVLPAANGGAGAVNGALKANGSGFVSQAACGDLSNAGAGCQAAIATATTGGLLPTPPNNTTTFLRGDATFAAPPTATNCTSTAAGLVPTPPNNTTTFLRGDCTFAAPTAPFTITYLWVRQEQTSGTAPAEGTPSATTWTQRVLTTTKVNTIASAAVSMNQISLPAGTYQVTGFSAMGSTGVSAPRQVTRVQDITDTSTLIISPSVDLASTSTAAQIPIQGIFTLGGTKTIELDQYAVTLGGADTFGTPLNSGSITEVYVDLLIAKIG